MSSIKVEIKHNLLSETPFENDNDSFLFENTNIINQMVQEVDHGSPTSYLISGYRGSGKTSFIKKVEQNLTNIESKALFIKLDFPKYENYSLLLRKIIREVYLTLKNKEEVDYNKLESDYPDEIARLEVLYERTFNDIKNTYKDGINTEVNTILTSEINIKKLLTGIIFTLLFGLNIKFDLLNLLLTTKDFFDVALLVASTSWSAWEVFKIKQEHKTNKKVSAEFFRKTLYDDEIAEYRLNESLKDLNKMRFKPVFVIDELDKIDNQYQMDLLLGEIKPLMLSGLASYILVSGQNLYYKFDSANVQDDAIMASIFSKTIHIPLMSTKGFILLFKQLTASDQVEYEIVEKYIKSLILRANRIPRRFINLIRQEMEWNNGKATLTLKDENFEAYKTDARLLEKIDKIIEDLKKETSEGFLDFFITHLHIWLQKMMNEKYFSKEAIFNVNEEQQPYKQPDWVQTKLNTLIDSLLETLVESSFIQEENKKDEDIARYRWVQRLTYEYDLNINFSDAIKYEFLKTYSQFENNLREIHNDFIEGSSFKHSLNQMINRLVGREILSKKWLKDEKLDTLRRLRNNIAHGNKAIEVSDKQMREYIETIMNYTIMLEDEYTEYLKRKK